MATPTYIINIIKKGISFYEKNHRLISEQEKDNARQIVLHLIDDDWFAYNQSAYLLYKMQVSSAVIWGGGNPQSPFYYPVVYIPHDDIKNVLETKGKYLDSGFQQRRYTTRLSAAGYDRWYKQCVKDMGAE